VRSRARLGGWSLLARGRLRALASAAHLRIEVDRTATIPRGLRISIDRRSDTILEIAERVRIEPRAGVRLSGGRITLDSEARIAAHAYIETAGGNVVVGASSEVGPGSVLRPRGGLIEIGAGASLGDRVVVYADAARAVRIGPRATIGSSVVLLPGSEVALGATVPNGAVVAGPFPTRSVHEGATRA
jgi:acetyltransferase-like isoleucine patch superfamily enzyme